MARWADRLKEVQKYERHVKTGLAAANNHYAGFGPACMCDSRVMGNDYTQECPNSWIRIRKHVHETLSAYPTNANT